MILFACFCILTFCFFLYDQHNYHEEGKFLCRDGIPFALPDVFINFSFKIEILKKKKKKGNFSHFPLKIILAENQRFTSARKKSLILITFPSIKGACGRLHLKNISMGEKTGRSWRILNYFVL